MIFNEDSRVKLPAILHLTQLGYTYISLKTSVWDTETNIFTDIFKESIAKINNHEVDEKEIHKLYQEVSLLLDNEDLGKTFYERLTQRSGIKLIDFDNFGTNSFHVCTELPYKNGEDNFRPDIICLINGMPLVFIEVKKPNNKDGVLAERKRIQERLSNKQFRKFVNITQFMIFSNNMEYDTDSVEPWQGAYYATPSYNKPIFNYFREEIGFNLLQVLAPLEEKVQDFLLADTNHHTLKSSPEFETNKNPDSATNRILTSLLSKARLAFMLRYSLAYVKETSGLQKHIMRYPQIFATKAIEEKLEQGIQKGIIWHTQGSGKTALAYYNTHFLTDYYQKKEIIPKFYFIVDRIDLLKQARDEFTARGLKVHTVDSREEFMNDLKITTAIHNTKGQREITVVNIQKFKDDASLTKETDYPIHIQRVYFLDEVHRSYNPEGSFLANLKQSDPKAIKLGLTGTPLIGKDLQSKQLFGNYIHKYYYNKSIADGYTLRLIREEIDAQYKILLQNALDTIEIKKGDVEKTLLYAHRSFVAPMLQYIVEDFEKFRTTNDDASLGAMVICHSGEQAKEMFTIFNEQYAQKEEEESLLAAEEVLVYGEKKKQEKKVTKAALVLYNSGSKSEIENWINEFKDGKIDVLFVDKMLLTGFDAKRLKKLYVGKIIRAHNLLQALTRVNRTYKDYKYGYVVDFADISKEFDKTNKAYFDELQEVTGDEMESYSNLFMSFEEMKAKIREIKEVLADYDTQNSAYFSQQISEITDRSDMLQLKKALEESKSLYNIIRLVGEYELLEKLDFKKLQQLRILATNRLDLLNAKEAFQKNEEVGNILNIALEDVVFEFTKIGESEMVLGDELKNILRQTREALASNFDTKDPEWTTLYEELRRMFDKNNLSETSQTQMQQNIKELRQIHEAIKELNRRNRLVQDKYNGDKKIARVHKRLVEAGRPTKLKSVITEALQEIKKSIDVSWMQRKDMLTNERYFAKAVSKMVNKHFEEILEQEIDYETTIFVTNIIVKEYLNEYYDRSA